MLLFTIAIVAIGLLCVGWYLHEYRWDRRLFGHRTSSDFVVNLRAEKAAELLREGGLLPIDVRPAPSYRAGHLPNAINASFEGSLDIAALEGIDRARPVLIYCDGGYRSRRSIPFIQAAGFTSIYHLHRGMISWKMAKKSIEPGSAT